MMKTVFSGLLAAAVVSLGLSSTAMAGDPALGEKVFKKCKACHVVDSDKNKTGPHLVNIMGRQAGSVEGFTKYSKAIKESGIVWDEATLDGFWKSQKPI